MAASTITARLFRLLLTATSANFLGVDKGLARGAAIEVVAFAPPT